MGETGREGQRNCRDAIVNKVTFPRREVSRERS